MSEVYELTATHRTEHGKAANRRMRRLENKIPAVVYGGDKNPVAIVLDHNLFANALENEAFYSHILTLDIQGKKEKVVLKDLHRHPSRPKILHADFLRVSAKTKITMNIPLHFKGGEEAPGVKTQGGIVAHLMTEIEVRCLPKDLPEFIEVKLSHLAMGESIHLSQLKIPKGVEVTALQGEGQDQPVASIHKPTIVVEPTISAVGEEVIAKPEGTEPESEAEGEA